MNEVLVYVCEICQTVLDVRNGEAVCPNCGRTLDASDLAVVRANAVVTDDDGVVPCPGSDPRDFMPKAPAPDQPVVPAAPPQAEGPVADNEA